MRNNFCSRLVAEGYGGNGRGDWSRGGGRSWYFLLLRTISNFTYKMVKTPG